MSLRNKKLFAGFVGAALSVALLAGAGASVANAGALTSAQVSAIISLLQSFGADQATINNVQASLTGGTPAPTTPSTTGGYTFTRNLKQGDTGADVMNLQKVLNMDPATQVAASGAGSKGMETSTFGPATKAAVIKFQNKYASEVLTPVGLTSGTGTVGAMTRAKLTQVSGGTVVVTPPGTVTPPATGTGITVSDPGQPGVSLAPASAARLPFTKVRLTAGNDGDVTVNSITIERTGLAQDAVFSGAVLIDENGLQLGDAKTFNSNHQATIGIPFTVKAGTSRTLTIAGNMASSLATYAGQVATLTVVSVNTNGAVVSGTLPITGAAQTINASLTLGSVTMGTSSYDPSSGQSKEIGTTGYKFTGFRMTAGSAEKVRLWSVRWYQSGSAASSDLANIQTYVDGVAYPTTIDSTGKYYTSLFPGGILIDKGNSTDIWVSGDIVGSGASSRTVQFDVFKTTDLYLTGETYGYGITPPAGSAGVTARTATAATVVGTGSNPWIQSATVTVSAGSATAITKSSAVPAQNIAVNVPNQPLGGFMTDIKGEAIAVQSLVFSVATSSDFTSGPITNVTIVDQNGAVVAGPVDEVIPGKTLTFTDTITFPVGQRVYTLKGKIPTGTSNGATVYITSNLGTGNWSNVTGMTTGNTISLPTNTLQMNTMTVRAANLTVTVSPTPASQTIVAGSVGRIMANFQFDATQSGEDLRFSAFKPTLTFSVPNSADNLSGCQLFDGGTALNTSSVVNPGNADTTGTAYQFTFDQALVIPKNTVKTLALKCNISGGAGATDTFQWGQTSAAATLTATGQTSGSTLALGTNLTITAATGQTMSISTGSLTVTGDASSPSYTMVTAGTSGQVIGGIKFRATTEAINLTKIALNLANTTTSTANDLTQVTIWDGATQVGSATFTGNNTTATSTFTSTVVVPKSADKILTIKADLSNIGSDLAATSSGHLLTVDYLANSGEATGSESGIAIPVSGTAAFNGVRIMKSYPIITYSTSAGVASNGTNDLLSINIQASTAGDVMLNKLTFVVSSTTVTTERLELFGPNGNVSSSTINMIGAASSTLSVFFDSATNTADKTIAAGASKTYTVRAYGLTLTGTNSTGSLTIALAADSAYPTIPATTGIGAVGNLMGTTTGLASSKTIWSPLSTTTSVTTSTNDWTNGYGLPGCFTSSGLGQNCPSRTISK